MSLGLEPIFQDHYVRRIQGVLPEWKQKNLEIKGTPLTAHRVTSPLFSIGSNVGTPLYAPSSWSSYNTIQRREDIMGDRYIKREEVKITVERLDKKHKGKYRFKAVASAPLHYEKDVEQKNSTMWTFSSGIDSGLFKSSVVYSKTENGAEVSALTDLLHKCRPPLSKEQKIKDKQIRKEGGEGIKRSVHVKVKVSNAFDFIMNEDSDNKNWYEIS